MKLPRRRSLMLASQQKSFLCVSDFARVGFFLLKGKVRFSARLCSDEQGGGASLRLGRLGIPPLNPPAEPSSLGRADFLAADLFFLALAPPLLCQGVGLHRNRLGTRQTDSLRLAVIRL